MWNRADLKERGRNAFKRNYWKSVLVSLVLMILVSGSGSSSSESRDLLDNHGGGIFSNVENSVFIDDDFFGDDPDLYYDEGSYSGSSRYNFNLGSGILDILAMGIFGAIGVGIALLFAAAAIAINIFICSPIEIGGCRFFIENAFSTPGAGLLFFAFQSGHYGKMVFTLFLKKLYIVLWSLLLIIPGIVKSYEYRMVSYLMADNPELSRQDAFQISKEMMDGEKMNAFILDLSFIGWNILSALTLGLVGLFYVNPYENATNAELYLELKRQYFGQGTGYTGRY